MKLYMKQKVFSFRDKFYIKDEYEQDKYYVEGELLSLGKKLHIFDNAGNELAMVQEKVISFLPTFFVYANGKQIAKINKRFSLVLPRYYVDGLEWDVEGDVFAHDYEIRSNHKTIVNIHKVWMSWGDAYEIDIDNSCDELIALSVVLAIDCAILRSRQS